ncbi:MAG TPA: sensor histidine kinase [Pseudomonadales bacterium]|nr:sensor histidine kinase [Pseudomonadales bacterium]
MSGELVLGDDSPVTNLQLIPYIDRYAGSTPLRHMQDARQIVTGYVPLGTASSIRQKETNWFRFAIRNKGSRARSLVLDFDQALYSRLEWDARSATTARYILTGQDYPYATRDINYSFFAFHLDIPPGETLVVNFAIYTPYAALLAPQLTEGDAFISKVMRASRIAGSVIGMLFSMCLFLSVYVLRMRKFGLAHTMLAFSVTCFFSVLYINGAVQRFIPDQWLLLRDMAYLLIHGLQGIFFLALVRRFYHARGNYPLFDKLFLLLMVSDALMLVLMLVMPPHDLIGMVLTVNGLAMLASLLLGVISLLQKKSGTYLFSAGLIIFNVVALFSAAASFGLVPVTLFTRYGYELGLTIQVDFLALAVASTIFSAGREKLAMETQVIKLNADIQARSEFVDRVTHDIKSPLTAVMGAEQLLRNAGSPADRERYLDIIRSACGNVVNIVDDILNHSRIGQGELVLRNDAFDLQVLLDEIESAFRASHTSKPIMFTLSLDDRLPSILIGDRLRVFQVLTNLLNNAFKFTDEGRVDLRVELADKQADNVQLRFIVQDTGIGMSAAFINQAFNSYSREEARSDYRPGFGLGLAICKQLVDRMGGVIDVQSTTGIGSRFEVLLPFALPH